MYKHWSQYFWCTLLAPEGNWYKRDFEYVQYIPQKLILMFLLSRQV